MHELSKYIRSIPDFPKKGILFRDVTTLLKDKSALQKTVEIMTSKYKDLKIDKVVAIESRGFILGSALAVNLGAGFVPIRKKGKLPAEVIREEYELEYGKDIIEIHKDALNSNERIILHDDLLATGGTMLAAVNLVKKLNVNIVSISFLIELCFLQGRNKLEEYDIFSIIQYDSE